MPLAMQHSNHQDYIYDEAATLDIDAYQETRGVKPPKMKPEVASLDSVIVDKRYYNYMCEFWAEDLQPIQTACDIQATAVRAADSNDIEIHFANAKDGTCQEWQERFIQFYQRLLDKVCIEIVDITNIQDMTSYRNEIESKFKCLCFVAHNKLEIVCLRSGLDLIRASTKRHCTRSGTLQSPWPVGYDVAGSFSVYIYKADITKLNVDAIASAANEHLRHGGGVARAILEAAGDELDKASKDLMKKKKKIPTSNVEKTVAGEATL
jgi:hypothetical protein